MARVAVRYDLCSRNARYLWTRSSLTEHVGCCDELRTPACSRCRQHTLEPSSITLIDAPGNGSLNAAITPAMAGASLRSSSWQSRSSKELVIVRHLARSGTDDGCAAIPATRTALRRTFARCGTRRSAPKASSRWSGRSAVQPFELVGPELVAGGCGCGHCAHSSLPRLR
jgi:hypothetical protein